MAKICIDPGHAGGKTDPGAVNPITNLQEADVNLAVSTLVKQYLEAVGYQVLLTRTQREQPETHSVSYRCNLANLWGADLVVSIHCNAAISAQAHGTEIYTTLGKTEGDRLATCIINQITSAFPELWLRADWDDGDPDKEQNFIYCDIQTHQQHSWKWLLFLIWRKRQNWQIQAGRMKWHELWLGESPIIFFR